MEYLLHGRLGTVDLHIKLAYFATKANNIYNIKMR
jgi:hypothetical protein